MGLSEKMDLSSKMYKEFEWDKWLNEVPYIQFPKHFKVQITPPFTGAVVRFCVKHIEDENTHVSVYLDCYNTLGCYGEPYWEIYPYSDGDTYRCGMNEIEDLIYRIDESLSKQISDNIKQKNINKPSKFYHYNQNNSGGIFIDNDSVCEDVIIQARSAEEANSIAETIGIYFDGCSKGIDCNCCGDRWNKQYDEDGVTEIPMIYDTSVYEMRKRMFNDKCYIYYLDGTKEIVNYK